MLRKEIKRRHSASSLSLFLQCNMKYELKYVKGYYQMGTTPQMAIGTLAHACLETKLMCKKEGLKYDYKDGIKHFNKEFAKIKKEFADFDFSEYDEKIQIFFRKLKKKECDEYEIVGTEIEFQVEMHGETLIGSIDLLLRNKETKELKVIDYKTSKRKFSRDDANKSLQHAIYGYACYRMYGEVPTEYEYDFVFLDDVQEALSPIYDVAGYAEKVIYNIFKQMNECFDEDEYKPNKCILCTWCGYGSQIGKDDWFGGICEYEAFWNKDCKTLDRGKLYVPKKYRDTEDDNENGWG